jgi:peptidoglycan/LPS O-acetylase OafA/YrhL
MSLVFLIGYKQSVGDIFRYFSWNLILLNFMQPCVGNIFDSNVLCAVNGSLWTLKLEVSYYVFVGVSVFVFRPYAYRLVVVFSVISFILESFLYLTPTSTYSELLHNQIPFKFYYFGLGVIMFKYMRFITTRHFVLAFSVGFFGWFIFNIDFLFLPLFVVSFVFLVAFKIPIFNFSTFGNISYGLYIYHFPLIQLFVYNDWLTGDFYTDFGMISFLLFSLSHFSWVFIERKSIRFGNKMIAK